jgi:hypothetical protein
MLAARKFEEVLEGQRVFVTGHTGFTGGWLVLWLKALNCDVHALALPPDTEPNLFSVARIGEGIYSEFGSGEGGDRAGKTRGGHSLGGAAIGIALV